MATIITKSFKRLNDAIKFTSLYLYGSMGDKFTPEDESIIRKILKDKSKRFYFSADMFHISGSEEVTIYKIWGERDNIKIKGKIYYIDNIDEYSVSIVDEF